MFFVVSLSSCEKVIDVDLRDAEPKIVVEGHLTNIKGMNLLALSKTSSFYNNEEPERLRGAEVVVIDENGTEYILNEVNKGYYNNQDFEVLTNHNYKLEVKVDNQILKSSSYSPSSVKIDSVKIEFSEFSGPKGKGNHDNSLYKVTCYFVDPINEINFYRLRIAINGEYLSGFNVIDDKFFSGKTINYQFNGIDLIDNDMVRIELLGIDENNFQYYYMLSRIFGGGQDITPGNPPTNIEGNAIGIFGANTFDTLTTVFREEDLEDS